MNDNVSEMVEVDSIGENINEGSISSISSPKMLLKSNEDDLIGSRRTKIESSWKSNDDIKDYGSPNRIFLDFDSFNELSISDLYNKWKKQDEYIDFIEKQLDNLRKEKSELLNIKETEENSWRQQLLEANRKENVLVMTLSTKEQQLQDYINKIQELKQSQIPSNAQLQSTLMDPALNMMFQKMKQEVDKSRIKLEEMQSELSAWKFTPDSVAGKRLMGKCRLLHQENEELGKTITSGKIGKLEGELSLQKNFTEELKKSQCETEEFLLELDEEVEGMQNTIYHLQQQLKEERPDCEHFDG